MFPFRPSVRPSWLKCSGGKLHHPKLSDKNIIAGMYDIRCLIGHSYRHVTYIRIHMDGIKKKKKKKTKREKKISPIKPFPIFHYLVLCNYNAFTPPVTCLKLPDLCCRTVCVLSHAVVHLQPLHPLKIHSYPIRSLLINPASFRLERFPKYQRALYVVCLLHTIGE